MMRLANIVLKMDRIGNSVPKKYVTPAEVMFLTADHHANAGGEPIIALEEIEEEHDLAGLEQANADLKKAEARLVALDEDNSITPEVRHNRQIEMQSNLNAARDAVTLWQNRNQLRKLNPTQEKRRLSAIYGRARVDRVFPGQIPALPEDFTQAKIAGVGSSTGDTEDKFIMMSEGPR